MIIENTAKTVFLGYDLYDILDSVSYEGTGRNFVVTSIYANLQKMPKDFNITVRNQEQARKLINDAYNEERRRRIAYWNNKKRPLTYVEHTIDSSEGLYRTNSQIMEYTDLPLFNTDEYIKYFNEHEHIDYAVIGDLITLLDILGKTDEELGRMTIDNVIIPYYDVLYTKYKSNTISFNINIEDIAYNDLNYNIRRGMYDELEAIKSRNYKIEIKPNRITTALFKGYSKVDKKFHYTLNVYSGLLCSVFDDKETIKKILVNGYKTLTKTKVNKQTRIFVKSLIDNGKLTIDEVSTVIFKSKSKKNYEVLQELLDPKSEEFSDELMKKYKDFILSGKYLIGIENVADVISKEEVLKLDKSQLALMSKTSYVKYYQKKNFDKLLNYFEEDKKELNTIGIKRFKQLGGYYSFTLASSVIDSMTEEEMHSIKTELASTLLSGFFINDYNFNNSTMIVMTNYTNLGILAEEIFNQLEKDTNKNHIKKYVDAIVRKYEAIDINDAIDNNIIIRLKNSPLADISYCDVKNTKIHKFYVDNAL